VAATNQDKPHPKMEEDQARAFEAILREQVMHVLGEPDGLQKVQVRRLWKHHYRVNVLVGKDAACTRIADSFFVTASNDGNIIASCPKITKQYGSAEPVVS